MKQLLALLGPLKIWPLFLMFLLTWVFVCVAMPQPKIPMVKFDCEMNKHEVMRLKNKQNLFDVHKWNLGNAV